MGYRKGMIIMTEKMYVGVDLGGTTVKLAFVNKEGDMIHKWEIPTNTSDGGKHITKDIATSIEQKRESLHIDKSNLMGIGMGAPGFINFDTGFVYRAVNIGWEDFPLKDQLEKESELPVIVENDANMAALGEMWQGAGKGASDLLCLTLGTGVGGGVITDGQIVHGITGMAGELGHITMIPEGGYPCNCGKTGCLETLTSATGIRRLAIDSIEDYPTSSLAKKYYSEGNIDSKDIFEAAVKHDPLAEYVVQKVTFYLGWAIANLAIAFNPEKIIIGGGVSKAGDSLIKPLKEQFKKYALPRVYEGAQLRVAELGNDAGVIGGAWLVHSYNYSN